MFRELVNEVALWRFNTMHASKEILHFVSGRSGGVSKTPFDSLNLSFSAGDEREAVLENRNRLALAAGVQAEKLVFVSQIHSNRVLSIKETKDAAGQEADGLVTASKGLCICVMGADCVPVLFYDPQKKVIGAAHAGWRGTAAAITSTVISHMVESYQCDPVDLLIGIGPSASQEKYEVGEEVYELFLNAFGEEIKSFFRFDPQKKKYFPDLWSINKWQAERAGVPAKQIEIGGICTVSHPQEFYSARYFKNVTGRFAAGIQLI